MGSTYFVKVTNVDGAKAVFDCLPSGAGEVKDCAASRSFAVMLLHDAVNLRKDVASPVELAFPSYKKDGMQKSWYEQNAGKIVASTRVIARHNDLETSVLDERYDELREEDDFEKLAREQLFHYELEVSATDAKFLSHLKPGLEFATIGFNIWREA